MSNALTATEEKVYQYLIEFLSANSYQPSIREIGRQFDIKSTKTVSDVLGSLARKGYIQRNQARSRGLRILGAQASATRAVPCYDQLPAAGTALSADLRTDSIIIDRRLAASDDTFAVRVVDSAMAPCGIRAGDTVLVNPGFEAMDGDLVVVRIGQSAAVRTFVQRGDFALYVGAASDVPAIDATSASDDLLLGVVAAVFRGMLQVESADPDAVAAA